MGWISRSVTYIIGALTLVQSVIWMGLAYVGLCLYSCCAPVHYNELKELYFVFLAYFYTDCAVSPNVELGINNSTNSSFANITVTWPDNSEWAPVTHRINTAYVVLSTFWAFTSVVLIGASICCPDALYGYLPWIVITAANLLMDVVATFIYLPHISETKGFGNFLNFLGANYTFETRPDVPDEVTRYPSMLMTWISSRFIVIWLLDVIFLTWGIWKIVKQRKPSAVRSSESSPETHRSADKPSTTEHDEDETEAAET